MPLHLPGYKYCGPGTKDFSVEPINELDSACREHDLSYDEPMYYGGKKVSPYTYNNIADQRLVARASKISGPAAMLVSSTFRAKALVAPFATKYPFNNPRYSKPSIYVKPIAIKAKKNQVSSKSLKMPSVYMKSRLARRKKTSKSVRAAFHRGQAADVVMSNARTGGAASILSGDENKFFDTELVDAALTAPADATGGLHNPTAAVCLNAIAQGDGASNRDGRVVTQHSIVVHGIIDIPVRANQTAGITSPYVYVAVVLDTQANGAVLTTSDVFLGVDTKLMGDPLRNLFKLSRFKILAYKKVYFPQIEAFWDGTNGEMNGKQKKFTLYANLKGLRTLYVNTTSDIANITDNSLNLVAFCSTVSANPTLTYVSRVRFAK